MDQTVQMDPPAPRSNWPSTLGIVSLIFGILGFLTAASYLVNTLMMKFMGASMFSGSISTGSGDEQTEAIEQAMEEAMVSMMTEMEEIGKIKIIADGGLLILGIALFVGGILLMQRFRIAKPILLGFAYGKLIINSWSALLMQKIFDKVAGSMGAVLNEQMAMIDPSSSAPPFDMVKMYEIMGTVTMIIMAVWGAILPIILIIWFNRQATKDDMEHGYGWK